MAADRIRPGDAPRANHGIPRPERCPVHVHAGIRVGTAIFAPRHDPYVLYCAAFERARGVNLTSDLPIANVDAAIAHNLEIPTSAKPSVQVIRLGNIGRTP